jgi:hypothetical protein
MITVSQQRYIEDYAYVPEHLSNYVTAISQTEPFFIDDFLVHVKKDHLIFVGYPLKEPLGEKQMVRVLENAIQRFKPKNVALIAPAIPSSVKNCVHPPPDHYYRLDLSSNSISQKLRNMLKRADRELSVERNNKFDEEHRKMIAEFLKTHPVDEAAGFIFNRIDEYLSSSPTTRVFDARNKRRELVAFDIAEFKPRDYSIYMFNFSSDALYVPGASDLLLSEVIKQAKTERKKYINLGLGINSGVTFFKEKWGGVAFLPYASCLYHSSRKEDLEALLQKL